MGKGRLSTLEACAIFIAELEGAGPPHAPAATAQDNAPRGGGNGPRVMLPPQQPQQQNEVVVEEEDKKCHPVMAAVLKHAIVPLAEVALNQMMLTNCDPSNYASAQMQPQPPPQPQQQQQQHALGTLPHEETAAALDDCNVADPPPPSPRPSATGGSAQLRKAKCYAQWVTAVESESSGEVSVDFPLGLRRCRICGTRLATPLRMELHLKGRKHAEGVVALYCQSMASRSGGGPSAASTMLDTPPVSSEAAAAVLAEYSTALLAGDPPDPPDAAMVSLWRAFAGSKRK